MKFNLPSKTVITYQNVIDLKQRNSLLRKSRDLTIFISNYCYGLQPNRFTTSKIRLSATIYFLS